MLFDSSKFAVYDIKDPFEIDILFRRRGNTLYDLAYFLVDLNSVINTFHYFVTQRGAVVKPPTTSRFFTKKFKNVVHVKKFNNGSFWGNIGICQSF